MVDNSKKEVIWKIFVHSILIIFAVLCLIPMIITISTSFSNEMDIAANGISLFPRVFDLSAYSYIFKAPSALLNAYKVTIFVTVVGTILGVFVMSLISYPLSRSDFRWRGVIGGSPGTLSRERVRAARKY